MSSDPTIDPEVISMLGTSAALSISGVPFNGPIGAARVGYRDGAYLLNPTYEELETSDLDLVVAGTDKAVLMVESEANVLSEDVMLGAVMHGHEQMQVAISAIKEMAAEVGTPAWDWQAPEKDESLEGKVAEAGESLVGEAYKIADKMERQARMSEVRSEIVEKLTNEETSGDEVEDIKGAIKGLEKKIVRGRILDGEARIDGRDTRSVRPITVRTGVLPRVHGSALFTRGETQALVVTTLGTQRDSQIIDALQGSYREPFIFHYNFPPYSVGECGRVGTPKRREIGHGRLAKRGILAVVPNMEEYPYTIRVVSEITESNGSSSMASVCGSSLSMMDAGVPLKAPVAGIAMGLVKEENRFAVLSDILGDEDHLGDMDFKVAGPADGITALQMDIKIEGITREIMEAALVQAKEGRQFILDNMNKVIAEPREELSEYAPRIMSFKINPDKIRDVIGKGAPPFARCAKKRALLLIWTTMAPSRSHRPTMPPLRKLNAVLSRSPLTLRWAWSTKARSPSSWTLVHSSPFARQRWAGTYFADLPRARGEGQRQVERRRDRQGQGTGSRQTGPYPSEYEGIAGTRGTRGLI